MSKIFDLLGLGQLKLSVTTVVWIVAALAFAGVVGYGVYEAKQIKSLETAAGKATQQISDLTEANKALKSQIQLSQDSAKITNDVTAADAQQKQQAQTSSAAIASDTQAKITTIIQKYQPQGKTQVIAPAQAKAESDEISEARLDGMWKTYCKTVPVDTQGCVMVLPPAQSFKAVPNSHPSAQVGPSA